MLFFFSPGPGFSGGPPENMTITSNGSPAQVSVSFSTNSGANWLKVSPLGGTTPLQLTVTADPSALNLADGAYTGQITNPRPVKHGHSPGGAERTLASAASLSFTAPMGGMSSLQTLTISFNMGPVEFNLKGGGSWLQVAPIPGFNQAAPVYDVAAAAYGLIPGTYDSGLTIDWTTGSLTIPITLTVTPTSASPPVMSAIVSSASATPGAIAPGEIVSIFGTEIGGARRSAIRRARQSRNEPFANPGIDRGRRGAFDIRLRKPDERDRSL